MRQLSCDQHVQYRAGCPGCRARGRFYEGRRVLLAERGVRLAVAVDMTAARLKELRAAGYSLPFIADQTSLGVATLNRICNGRVDWVQLRVFQAIEKTYRELSPFPGPSRQVAGKAFKRGWAPPLPPEAPDAIPEDHVDDIAVERALAGDDSVCLTRAEKLAAWDVLAGRGVPANERIRMLRVSALSIERWRGGFQRKNAKRTT